MKFDWLFLLSGSFAPAICVLCLEFCFCLVLFFWICLSIFRTCMLNHQHNIFLHYFLKTNGLMECVVPMLPRYSKKTSSVASKPVLWDVQLPQLLSSFASVILFTRTTFQGPSDSLWPCFRLLWKDLAPRQMTIVPQSSLTRFQIQIPSLHFVFVFTSDSNTILVAGFPRGEKQ